MCAVHTAPDFRLKVNFPPSFPTPRSWTLMHMWGRFLFFICPEQVPSLRARQPRFLLLVPPHVSLPWKNRAPPRLPPPSSTAEARFISFSPVLSHGDFNTGTSPPKSHSVSSCPQRPFKTCCLSIARYDSLSTVNTADLISSLRWSRW